jgi:CheY-like chemotaxis protein
MIRLHVLFADDEADVREIIAMSLRQDLFFVARGCASGGEALKTAFEWRPDLALLDVTMPEMDGPSVLARLRADKRTAAMPVVFMTGHADKNEHARLKTLGATGVISKPLDSSELAAALRRFVPLEGVLAGARREFLLRLHADASALSACRLRLSQRGCEPALVRINEIAHALAGAGGIYGFAGITSESAALSDLAENSLAGRAGRGDVEQALDRLLRRITPSQQALQLDAVARR